MNLKRIFGIIYSQREPENWNYKPIFQSFIDLFFTETQKATAREITEGLKPIKEGIEKLPKAMQPIEDDWEEKEDEEYDEYREEILIREQAEYALNRYNTDKRFGVRKIGDHHYIGNKHVIISDNDIIIPDDGERFMGTPGLWELITSKNPFKINYNKNDLDEYKKLMIKTNALHRNSDPLNPYPRTNKSMKWSNILSPIWNNRKEYKKKYGIKPEGKGVVVIPSDPNALLERLDLLLASQEAGHTGVGNELVSICDELKRQGVLDL